MKLTLFKTFDQKIADHKTELEARGKVLGEVQKGLIKNSGILV